MLDSVSSPKKHFGEQSRIADFIQDEERALRVATSLIDSGAYYVDSEMDPEKYYTWKSGIRAPCYCNCRQLLSLPNYRRLVGTELAGSIAERFGEIDAVVGVATAGIAWAAAVADQLELQFAYVRSEKKSHGVGGLVQGTLPADGKIVIIDDLVASGGSLLSAVDAVENETGCSVIGIQSIVNWGFERMRGQLGERKYNALTSYPYILTAAMMKGLVSPNDMQKFLDFYEDPSGGFPSA